MRKSNWIMKTPTLPGGNKIKHVWFFEVSHHNEKSSSNFVWSNLFTSTGPLIPWPGAAKATVSGLMFLVSVVISQQKPLCDIGKCNSQSIQNGHKQPKKNTIFWTTSNNNLPISNVFSSVTRSLHVTSWQVSSANRLIIQQDDGKQTYQLSAF